jgi:hypothetical protein
VSVSVPVCCLRLFVCVCVPVYPSTHTQTHTHGRYGRPVGNAAASHTDPGEMDLATINQIIANLDGGGGAPAPVAPAPAPVAPAPSLSHGGVGLGLSSSSRGGGSSRDQAVAADDDARLAMAIAKSLQETSHTSSSSSAPLSYTPAAAAPPRVGGLGLAAAGAAGVPPAAAPLTPMQPPVRSAAGQLEEKLVSELTTPSGMRVAPGKDDLGELCVKAKTLDMPLMFILFCSKLEDPAVVWQVRVRALYCLEALVKTTDPEVKRDALKLMQARLPLVQALASANEKALADIARKVAQAVSDASSDSSSVDTPNAPGLHMPQPTSGSSGVGGGGLNSLFEGLNVPGGGAGGGGGGGQGWSGGGGDSLLSFDVGAMPARPAASAPIDLMSELAATPAHNDLLSGSPGNKWISNGGAIGMGGGMGMGMGMGGGMVMGGGVGGGSVGMGMGGAGMMMPGAMQALVLKSQLYSDLIEQVR